jgi:hypothetical protein
MAIGVEGKQWLERELRAVDWTLVHPRMEIFTINDGCVFPIYAGSGGVQASYICYVVIRGERGWFYDGGDLGREGVKDCGRGWVRAAVEFTYEQVSFGPDKVLELVRARAEEAAMLALQGQLPHNSKVLRFSSRVALLHRRLKTKFRAFLAA